MEEENCNFNDNEVLKEDAMGALALVSLSQEKLDTKTAIVIEVLHQKVRGIVQANEVTGGKLICRKTVPSTNLGLPKFSQIEQRDLPPIKRLDGLIGQCSKPFEKQLTESDVLSSQNRLLFTRDFAREELLPLLNSNENLEEGIEVKTYDFQGKEYDMVFKYWDRARMYHLQRGWRTFVADHGLKHIKDWISVWMFRHNQTKKLCFAITSRRVPITPSSQARNVRKNKLL